MRGRMAARSHCGTPHHIDRQGSRCCTLRLCGCSSCGACVRGTHAHIHSHTELYNEFVKLTEGKIEEFLASKGFDSKTFYRLCKQVGLGCCCRSVWMLCGVVALDETDRHPHPTLFLVFFSLSCLLPGTCDTHSTGGCACRASAKEHHSVVLCTAAAGRVRVPSLCRHDACQCVSSR